jgi:hypothetical protein
MQPKVRHTCRPIKLPDDLKASKDVHLKSNSIPTLFNKRDVLEQNPCQMQILFSIMLMKAPIPFENVAILKSLVKKL